MKKLFFLIACMAVMTANAQNSGFGFNYQAVLRNSEGITLTDTPVNLRVSLYAGQYASTLHGLRPTLRSLTSLVVLALPLDKVNGAMVQNFYNMLLLDKN